MGRIKALLRKTNITKRLILYFSILIAIQMVLTGWFSYSWESNYLKNMYISNMRGINSSIIQQLNSIRSNYEELSDRFLANVTIQSLLVKDINVNSGIQFINDVAMIDDELFDPTDTTYALIARKDGILFYPVSGTYPSAVFDQVKNSRAYDKSLESYGNNIWISANENMVTGTKEPFLYVCRTYRSVELHRWPKVLGQLIIQIPIEKLSNVFMKINMQAGENYEVIDNEGNYIYSTESLSKIGEKADNDMLSMLDKDSTDYCIIKEGKEDLLISHLKDQDGGWSIIHILPMKIISLTAEKVMNNDLLIMLLVLLALLPLLILMSRNISRPVRKLNSIMEDFGAGNLAIRGEINRMDEIGHLQASFNKMAEDINNLLDKNAEENKQLRLMELNMIEYQINPHFLYNSLDSINWMAHKAGNEDIEEMVTALARFFRVGLSKGKEFYKIGDELEHVRQYLLINKIRFKDCFDFSVEAGPEVLEYSTIKIILQPIVENAIKYGIDKSGTNGFIRVNVKLEENSVLFEVSDNGAGIPGERLNAIQKVLTKHTQIVDSSLNGFGLLNVNQRIWMQFGEGYGIIIDSVVGIGTIVHIRIPLLQG